MTISVSNVNTLKRQLVRRGGALLDMTPAVAQVIAAHGHDVAAACVVADPDGVVSVVLHKFKRSPLMSLTLGCSDVASAAGTGARPRDGVGQG